MRTSTTQIPLGLPLNRSHSLCKGLVGCWSLNEGGGQKAMDSCISTNFGALANGAAFTKHIKGSCVSFDGTDDVINTIGQLSTYSFVQNTQVFSVGVWFQLNNTTARQALVANISSVLTKGWYVMWENSAGQAIKAPKLVIGNGGAIQIIAAAPDNTITDLNWHHVVVTGRGTGNTITFYIDGVIQTTTYVNSFSSFSTGDSSFKLQFGILPNASPFAILNGKMNNIMIYNRTLSSTEAFQLYTNPYQMYQQSGKTVKK